MFSRVGERHGPGPSDGADAAAVADGPEPDPAQPVTAQLGHVLAVLDGGDLDVTGHSRLAYSS